MIVEVRPSFFPGHTFVLLARPDETIARLKGKLLHLLYGMDRHRIQFRLRYGDTYMSNSMTLRDYCGSDTGTMKLRMQAVHTGSSTARDGDMSATDSRFGAGAAGNYYEELHPFNAATNDALLREAKWFRRRERLLRDWNNILWTMIVVCAFVFGTKYWWGGFWSVVYIALALWYVPVFNLFGGAVREATWSDRAYFNAATLTCFLQTGGAAAIGTLLLLELFDDCSNSTGVCDTWHWYSTIVWLGWAFYLFVATTSAALLRVNFMHQPGDLLERAFQQHLDVSVCIKLARDGLRRDKRGAAIELGALAATGDDARQQIVDGGGVGTIVSLALSDDAATSEYAIESMGEMVSSPFCRDEFIRAGALRVLLTIAQTATPATGTAIVGALHYLIADESSRLRLAEEQAVSDLARFGLRTDFHAHTRRQLAHIYTELADCIPLRTRMAENVGTIKALAALSRGTAKGTHLLCLNALRMLAEADLSLLQKSAAIEMLLAPCSDSETAEAATKLLLRCTETELGAQSLLHAPGLALAFEGLLESAGRATHGLMAGLCRKLTVALGSEHSDARQGLIRVASFLVDAGRLDISAKRNMDRCLALLRK